MCRTRYHDHDHDHDYNDDDNDDDEGVCRTSCAACESFISCVNSSLWGRGLHCTVDIIIIIIIKMRIKMTIMMIMMRVVMLMMMMKLVQNFAHKLSAQHFHTISAAIESRQKFR